MYPCLFPWEKAPQAQVTPSSVAGRGRVNSRQYSAPMKACLVISRNGVRVGHDDNG